ncbi:MAG: hypothetical protein SCK70_17075, partial [bacterium]|nr:hypothetical protein [bacterium]
MQLPKKFRTSIQKQFLEAASKIINKDQYKDLDFRRNSYTAKFFDVKGEYWVNINLNPEVGDFKGTCNCNSYMYHMMCPHVA